MPGSYVEITRSWSNNDAITLELPMAFRIVRYTGLDQDAHNERYALLYGPVLMHWLVPRTSISRRTNWPKNSFRSPAAGCTLRSADTLRASTSPIAGAGRDVHLLSDVAVEAGKVRKP